MTAAQVQARLDGLAPADLRKVRDHEKRHANRKTVLRAIDHLLARSLDVVAPPVALDSGAREVPGPDGLAIRLSDHPPVVASFGLR